MKYATLTTILLIMFICLQPAQAYSPFFNMDRTEAPELKKLGITITLKHQLSGEINELDWVQIAYDTSKLNKNLEAYMVLQVISDNGKLI